MGEALSSSENEPATKGDLSAVRADLRGEMADMRSDMALMRDDIVTSLRTEIREMLRPITITLANHTAELADIRGHIKDKMVTRDEFHARMDGFTGRVDDSDYSSAKNRDRLDDHAKRISALEEKHS